MFKVMKHDMDRPTYATQGPTQCGGAVKTAARAARLAQLLRSRQPAGSSVWFTVEPA